MNQYFHLFSCCIPVKGFKKAVICDLQRNIIQPIPVSLYEMLISEDDSLTNSYDYFSENYGEKEKQLIKEYITFLYNNQFGYTTDKPMTPIRLDLSEYEECRSITNAIIDFNQESKHTLSHILPQLNELNCFALEIRYFYPVTYHQLKDSLIFTDQTSIKNVELLFEFSDEFELDNVLELKKIYTIIKKIIIYSSNDDVVYNRDDLSIIYTSEKGIDERCCGVTNDFYCIAETKLFVEAIHFNSCLNKKISVDKNGMIKNCPSMKDSFGHISTTTLKEALQKDAFRMVWKINKDKIEVCSDCELRYVCQDCRAYIEDNSNIYSKPMKCTYDPYE